MNGAVEASRRVRSSMEKVCSRSELAVDTTRTGKIKDKILELIHVLDKEDSHECFKVFSEAVLAIMQSVVEIKKPAVPAKIRERIWVEYANVQANKLPKYWKELCDSLCCPHIMNEPLVMQLTNQQIFEEMLTATFKTYDESIAIEAPITLSVDEENVLRYACGYVARKLRQKFLKQHGDKYADFVECLTRMKPDGEDPVDPATSFLDYTTQWIKIVNRGGLYEVNDDVFLLFNAIEKAMQVKLMSHLEKGTNPPSQQSSGKEEIIQCMLSDSNVLFYWDIVSYSIQDDGNRLELLSHIARTWLTIRGFSITSQWMEQYKSMPSADNKKKKGLRKELKKLS